MLHFAHHRPPLAGQASGSCVRSVAPLLKGQRFQEVVQQARRLDPHGAGVTFRRKPVYNGPVL